ncbi:pyridoxal phosphate-dependent transferase [Dipodascopsis tothii]|uniref:pyridoxal phosphate-dependent transferase n=1 Tax=Dipodascopsis tothii TaxID=44089 RepID=UPI0034CD1341
MSTLKLPVMGFGGPVSSSLHTCWRLYQGSTALELARNAVFILWASKYFARGYRQLWGRGLIGTTSELYDTLARKFFKLFYRIPSIRKKVDLELKKTLQDVEDKMIPKGPDVTYYNKLPADGWSDDAIKAVLIKNNEMKHSDWESGKVSGAIYHGGRDMIQLQTEAYGMYSTGNQLHPDVFPGLRKMEAEVVSMVLDLFNGPEGSVGTTTSGGTESLLMACLAAKMKAYNERGVTEPEIIAPVTIHAGFDKAAYYFNMKLRHVPIDPVTYQVDTHAVKRLVNGNTVLIAGSAPNFPHGIIDNIEELSNIAVKYDIPLHVDACLGSFVVPFLEQLGIDPGTKFDFRVPGVTSISCDTHKYGFAPKGSSVIMYRSASLRKYQYFLATEWSGGIYASPTLAGSRPGALMAGCWASLMKMGKNGYLESCRDLTAAVARIRSAIDSGEIPALHVLGNPVASVVAFSSSQVNIYDISDAMTDLGWHLSALQNPAALHIACTRLTLNAIDTFIADMKSVVTGLLHTKELQELEGIKTKVNAGETSALYGVAGSISTKAIVDELAIGFLDNLYK